MILIVVVDDKNGMLFNHRRQSKDRILNEKILSLTEESTLWMNHYTAALFGNNNLPKQIRADEEFLEKAECGEYCFAENQLPEDMNSVEAVILFRWNRRYPGDFFFNTDLGEWKKISEEEFAGYSHEKITMEVYAHADL